MWGLLKILLPLKLTTYTMLKTKCSLIFVILLCAVHGSVSKPADGEITQGRGIGSTLWGWITYPFSWWSSNGEEPIPVNDQLIASTTLGPYDNIEIGKHNVTVWCNDQTCTTMKCNKEGCKNNTCNIYDTNTLGECREYTTIINPEEPIPHQPTTGSKPADNSPQTETSLNVSQETPTKGPEILSIPIVTADYNKQEEERPLELEVVMSSTVDKTTEKN